MMRLEFAGKQGKREEYLRALWRLKLNNGLKRFPADSRKITEVQEASCTFITHRSADIKEVFNAPPNAYKETL